MYPFLFEFPFGDSTFKIPSYGVFLASAFTFAYFSALQRAARWKEDTRHIENLFLIVIFSAVLGARLFHVFFEEFQYYLANPVKVFAVWEGGYTLYGAILASIFGIWLYCKAKKLPVLQFIDISAPATLLGIGVGRLGCFLAGCCWGIPTDGPLGVTFTNPLAFTPIHDQPLHPTQLYESAGAFLVYGYLRWRSNHRNYIGQLTFDAFIAYAIVRFSVEFFRGDDYRGYVFGGMISYSQLISLAILPVVIFLMVRTRKKPAT